MSTVMMQLFAKTQGAGDQIVTNTNSAIRDIIDVATPIGLGIVVLAFVVIGMMFIAGGQRGKEVAKDWILRVVIGSAIILFAIALANWLWSAFGGTQTFQ